MFYSKLLWPLVFSKYQLLEKAARIFSAVLTPSAYSLLVPGALLLEPRSTSQFLLFFFEGLKGCLCAVVLISGHLSRPRYVSHGL